MQTFVYTFFQNEVPTPYSGNTYQTFRYFHRNACLA